ncbi:MAG: penicillin-insensitive murein endopeptidase, partial [Hyphomicrobiales bacterium]|nr:penicillin-insensitive murein endopeptidase [Hyphomicrobiales bacterium]
MPKAPFFLRSRRARFVKPALWTPAAVKLHFLARAALVTISLLTFVSAPRATEIENEPARDLFGAVAKPSSGAPRPIGFFSKGCLAGAVPLPLDGEGWQVVRLSRNR